MSAAPKMKPARPKAPAPKWDNIPVELQARPQWVLWAYAWREGGGNRPGKWTKEPRQPELPNKRASSTDPTTWTTFEAAKAAYLANRKTVDGVGYVFAEDDPFAGVDLDNCLTEDGEIEGWAEPHLDALQSGYLETSPSGRGIKAFLRGRLPGDGSGKKKTGIGDAKTGAIEVYQQGRFFTVTGDAYSEDPDLSIDLSRHLATIYEEVAAKPKGRDSVASAKLYVVPDDQSDDDIIKRARVSRNGPKFSALFDRGDSSAYADDESSADMALMNLLAFWTNRDKGRMERIFGRSALGERGKWKERPDYRQRTIAEAIDYIRETYKGGAPESRRDEAPSSNGHHDQGERNGTAPAWPRFNLTDLGNAERLVHQHGKDLRFCHIWQGSGWLVWDGRRWAIDNTAEAKRRAKQTVRAIYKEAAAEPDDDRRKALAKWAFTSEKRDKIAAMLALAESEPGVPILPDQMDREPWSFNAANGTIDLQTGRLRSHRREDLITKLCPIEYDPDAQCPQWEATLRLFFKGDEDLIDYWQRIAGYALVGRVRDHVMPVAYGVGSNGKSTILGTLLDVFGPDYAMKCPPDMLMAKKTDSHPTDRADLFGKRLVVAIETESGRALNETMTKELTGGDKIRARRMRENFWEFDPSHTLIMATNHKPVIRGTDHGIWRRVRLIPFAVTVSGKKADKAMPEKLKAEFPGILAWCVRGCQRWLVDELKEPQAVIDATAEYRKEQDILGAFLDEECIVGGTQAKASELYARYRKWAEQAGETVATQRQFGLAMTERGFERKTNNGTFYEGLAMRPSGNEPNHTR